MIEARIEDLLAEKFQEDEFADCFLIEVKLHANQKLEVFIDSDSGITFDKCKQVSRFLEQHIEAGNWLGEKYVLEVSSPGIGRPLKLKRQYPKNIGRRLEITLRDWEKPKKGILLAVQDDHLILEEEVTVKQGKKKRKEKVQTTIPFDAIEKTIVKVSF